jgi:hypothetical protein
VNVRGKTCVSALPRARTAPRYVSKCPGSVALGLSQLGAARDFAAALNRNAAARTEVVLGRNRTVARRRRSAWLGARSFRDRRANRPQARTYLVTVAGRTNFERRHDRALVESRLMAGGSEISSAVTPFTGVTGSRAKSRN